MDDRFEGAVVDSLRAGVAVLDETGTVKWTNAAWARVEEASPALAMLALGTNFFERSRKEPHPLTTAVAEGAAAILSGVTSYIEFRADLGPHQSAVLALTPLRGARGVVLLHTARAAGTPSVPVPLSVRVDASLLPERLTPREREVLEHMASGLDNRAIAKQLGIEYSTVRGYVQTVLEKLGARSRMQAVARAYRAGIVRAIEAER